MKKTSKIGATLLVVGAVAVLAALASITGGVSIRALPQQPRTLSMTTPVLPGVPFTVRADEGVINLPALLVRASGYEQGLPVQRRGADIVSELPCDVAAGNYQFVLMDNASNEIYASTIADVLPPGPDCY